MKKREKESVCVFENSAMKHIGDYINYILYMYTFNVIFVACFVPTWKQKGWSFSLAAYVAEFAPCSNYYVQPSDAMSACL